MRSIPLKNIYVSPKTNSKMDEKTTDIQTSIKQASKRSDIASHPLVSRYLYSGNA